MSGEKRPWWNRCEIYHVVRDNCPTAKIEADRKTKPERG